MSPKQMDDIFAAFNQADNSYSRKYGGIGIGLAITREMVELMGGHIGVSSEEGKGAVFTFSCSFPLAAEPAVEARGPETPNGDPNAILNGMRVLLVEDNEINTLIAAELLDDVGVDVTTAKNGREALEKLAENDMPVYALTAHALPEERARCLALGMGDHLTKPIDARIFYEALRGVAEEKARRGASQP